jgi:ketosteroid isomerase-like protein
MVTPLICMALPGGSSFRAQEETEAGMHPNEQVLRDLDEAQLQGDVEAFSDFFTEDVTVHFPGKNPFAGVHQGKEQFLELFGRFLERVPEFSFEPHAYLADDEHGVSLSRSHFKRGDETLDSNDTFVCHFRDGKISEFWLSSEDNDAVDAFLG